MHEIPGVCRIPHEVQLSRRREHRLKHRGLPLCQQVLPKDFRFSRGKGESDCGYGAQVVAFTQC
jgi:hypothetical protein